jgi:hypothetical protein
MPLRGDSIRVYVKRDEESSVGRGCVLYGAHFRPEISRIVWATCHAASEVSGAIRELWLTEGWRHIRETRDLHAEARALDMTFRMPAGLRPTEGEYRRIRERAAELLGPDYDVVCHASGTDALHLHIELDPK